MLWISYKVVVHCSVTTDESVLHNYVTHNEQSCPPNRDNEDLQTWAEVIADLKKLTFPSRYFPSLKKNE